MSEKYLGKIKPGDPFRDWLVQILGERIKNRNCSVRVFQFAASHMVRRFEFKGEGFSVMGKFFNKPLGFIRKYDPDRAMVNEYYKLKKISKIIDIPKPIAINRDFDCVLITEYISGKPLYKYFEEEDGLYENLTAVARLLRTLHDKTKMHYDKEKEFIMYSKNLNYLNPDKPTRKIYDELMGKWWYCSFLDFGYGCLIHHDATPANYLLHRERAYAIDFELSVDHGNPIHDPGILSAEIKNFFALRGEDRRAEPYIGHFLWQYSKSLDEFHRITRAIPFYMSYGLLRIARGEKNEGHKKYLLREAEGCLRSIERHQ